MLKRAILYRDERRPDMADGCPEKLNWEFIQWVWKYPDRTRPKIIELLEKSARNKQVIWLRSRAEAKRFFVRARAT